MEAIRTKDKLFLAVVMPLALAAAYVWCWRTDAVKRIANLSRESASLVAVEDFPLERARLEKMLAAARDEKKAEESRPTPIVRVRANAEDGIAARERAVLEVFRRAGLTVERSVGAEIEDRTAGEALKRTGLRPAPVCRKYVIVGGYPQLCATLRMIAEREMAVIPAGIAMSKPGHWELALWL